MEGNEKETSAQLIGLYLDECVCERGAHYALRSPIADAASSNSLSFHPQQHSSHFLYYSAAAPSSSRIHFIDDIRKRAFSHNGFWVLLADESASAAGGDSGAQRELCTIENCAEAAAAAVMKYVQMGIMAKGEYDFNNPRIKQTQLCTP